MDNPYKDSYVIQYDNNDVTLHRNTYFPVSTTNILTHTVKSDETLQSISVKYYGDSGGWYKIADYNGIFNPFSEVVEGIILKIPM